MEPLPRLRLLGDPALIAADGEVVPVPRWGVILAAWIVFEGGPLSREQASRLVWPEVDASRRAGNLRQVVRRIQSAEARAGTAVFRIGVDRIDVDRDAFSCDVIEFVALLDRGDVESVAAAVDLWGGTFVEGVDLAGAAGAWIAERRIRLRGRLVAAARTILDDPSAPIREERALALADRLSVIDPFEESAVRRMMRVFAGRADFEAVERAWGALSLRLARERGREPSDLTAALHRELVGGAVRGHSVLGGPPAAPAVGDGLLPRLALVVRRPQESDSLQADLAEAWVADLTAALWQMRSFAVAVWDRGGRANSAGGDYRLAVSFAGGLDRGLGLELREEATREVLWTTRVSIGERIDAAVARIADAVRRHVDDREIRSSAVSPEIRRLHRLTLLGLHAMRDISLPTIRRARAHFRAALAIRADFAPALAAMAKAQRFEWLLLGRGLSERDMLDAAFDFARKAWAADPDDARGPSEMGICQIYRKRHDDGLEMLDSARRIAPSDLAIAIEQSDAMIMSGAIADGMSVAGRIAGSIARPDDHLNWCIAGGYYLGANYGAALQAIDRMVSPETVLHVRAACHAMNGDLEEARRCVELMLEAAPDFRISARGAMVPLKSTSDIRHFEEGLRKAGFD